MALVDTSGAPLRIEADIDFPAEAPWYTYYFDNDYTVRYKDGKGKKTGDRIEKWIPGQGYESIPTYIDGKEFKIPKYTYCRVIEVNDEMKIFECTFVYPLEDGKTLNKYKLTSYANGILTSFQEGGRRRQRRKTSKTRSRRSRSRRFRSRSRK